jgi:hypothetical protein
VRSLAYWWVELDLAKSVTVHVETKTQHLRRPSLRHSDLGDQAQRPLLKEEETST